MMFNVKNMRAAYMVALLLIGQTVWGDMVADELNSVDQECSEDATRGHKKCKKYCNLTVCNKLKAGTLEVTGDANVAGNANVTGTLTAGDIVSPSGVQTFNELIIINPVIAVETGGNILDYGYFATSSIQAVDPDAAVTLDDAPVNSAGITLGVDQQTITFVNAGVYLLNAYMVGSGQADGSGSVQAGFEFLFANLVGSNRFSGGIVNSNGVTTMSGTAIVVCPTPGRTMTLNNISNSVFTLSYSAMPPVSTAGVSIVRLQ